MLDKGQIKDWEGEPEPDRPKPVEPAIKETALRHRALDLLAAKPEAIATGERVILSPEQVEARKRRSRWIALALFAFVILVFVLTLSKVGGGIPERM